MARPLPPLNAIRAFEAAARHGSFVAAATELRVTAGAISQQIKTLEASLRQPLFRRLVRGVALTEAGRAYRDRVADALDRLASASAELVGGGGATQLRVTALPAFAEKWLMPRLPGFQARHPEIELQLTAEPRIVDFAVEDYDLGLRYTDGRHPGLAVDLLFGDDLLPVCTPRLCRGTKRLRAPGDLARRSLLHDQEWKGDWQLWLEAAGATEIDARQGPTFSLYSMTIAAAVRGLGVAMGHASLVADELASGKLVAPFRLRVPAPRQYYLVHPGWAAHRPAVRAFRDWLLAEARAKIR